MSVIVKGVNVPKNCYTCAKYRWSPLCPCRRGDAQASYYRTSRHPDCPLVEITTPHGDLVDRNNLLEKAHYDYNEATHDYNKFRVVFEDDIIDAPVVIEGSL